MHYVVITFLSLALLLAVVAQGPLMECCNNQNLFRRVFGTPLTLCPFNCVGERHRMDFAKCRFHVGVVDVLSTDAPGILG